MHLIEFLDNLLNGIQVDTLHNIIYNTYKYGIKLWYNSNLRVHEMYIMEKKYLPLKSQEKH